MCGEQVRILLPFHPPEGSPPRVRGTAAFAEFKDPSIGITPACAGNSFAGRDTNAKGKDHPRVCGEQRLTILFLVNVGGSPPRVRGTVCGSSPSRINHGITPACAGNSFSRLVTRTASEDHPRVCGEQSCPGFSSRQYLGSPPRVRGTGTVLAPGASIKRITPACAGNRLHIQGVLLLNKDHPRVCGEQDPKRCPETYREGSPPRVRGTAV